MKMNEKNRKKIYIYIESKKKEGATWQEMIKALKISKGSLSLALNYLLDKRAITRGMKGTTPIYYIEKPNVKALFPEMYDRDLIRSAFMDELYRSVRKARGGKLFSEDVNKPQIIDQKAMIKISNKIGKIKFVSKNYKRFVLKKSITKLDSEAMKALVEVTELFGYRFVMQGENFVFERIDELAEKRLMLKDRLLGD